MIIAVAVVFGFKETVKDKLFVFLGNVQIAPFNPNPTTIITPEPFDLDEKIIKQVKSEPGVVSIFPFAVKPAILNSPVTMQGIKLKGVDHTYNWQSTDAINFTGAVIDYKKPDYSAEIVVSETVLNKLQQKIGDTLVAMFIDPQQEFPRMRKLKIVGSYHSGMEEVDDRFAFCDIRLLRRISNWGDKSINGYQVALKDYTQADTIANRIYQKYLQPPMDRTTTQEVYPNIFNWLELMNTNAYIILAIMAIVAVINMSTALLIFIMERTNMVGTLKALGMPTSEMQKIFLYHATKVALKGILIGTAIGVGFCVFQYYTHAIGLDEGTYYMQYVPIKLAAWHVILIDIATLAFGMLVMLIPSLMVRTINIVKALRFK